MSQRKGFSFECPASRICQFIEPYVIQTNHTLKYSKPHRDKIEGNELDLSLNQLTEVPVKELAAATKATCLDLSCNRIELLPNDFASLTHLVKIDLSKNKLTELPANFGNLLNLQHLDLYGNNIVNLPISFCRLKNLRWLDLKNNPLEPKLKNVAGDCLDEKECQSCAKKVVVYMQSIESDMERAKQKKLKAAREKEALEKAKLDKELEEQRRLKKLEKEKRKAESKAKKEAMLHETESQDEDNSKLGKNSMKGNTNMEQTNKLGAKGFSCLNIFFYIVFFVCLLLFFGILYLPIETM
ncbi:hypothetical protein JTE90_026525 [Oedothorax gibbosus]|uniref:Leucine-rich repeat-containing protein 59 n=1 Tax=Oedothorax gibbosus TaxID=931172 RepID=A0AAV6VQY3_9ARAC|nr:hypothetical protein JTE90_026525 [Oedothorax gibbosus]